MCGNPFKSHTPDPVVIEKPVVQEVEKVKDPEPQAITPTDTSNQQTRTELEKKKNRNKRGYQATRVTDRSVLTDTASNGAKSTLG